MWSHQSRVKGENHLSWPVSNIVLDTDLDAFGFLESKYTHCWSVFHFLSTSTPKSFSSGLFSFTPQSVLILEIILIQVKELAFGLGQLHCGSNGPTPPAPESASGRHSFSQANPQLIFMSSTNLLRVHLISLSLQSMKILNTISPSTDPWGTSLVTGFHLNIDPFTPSLWIQPSNHILILRIVHPSDLYLSNLEARL